MDATIGIIAVWILTGIDIAMVFLVPWNRLAKASQTAQFRAAALAIGSVTIVLIDVAFTHRQRAALSGGVVEVAGLVTAVWPDIEEQLKELWSRTVSMLRASWHATVAAGHQAWTGAQRLRRRVSEVIEDAHRMLLRRPPVKRAAASFHGSGHVTMPMATVAGSGSVSLGTLEERVTRLESNISDLRTKIGQLPDEWQRDIDASEQRQIHLRVSGLVLLIFGILLTVASNLMPV